MLHILLSASAASKSPDVHYVTTPTVLSESEPRLLFAARSVSKESNLHCVVLCFCCVDHLLILTPPILLKGLIWSYSSIYMLISCCHILPDGDEDF